jgi:hypothetical protein
MKKPSEVQNPSIQNKDASIQNKDASIQNPDDPKTKKVVWFGW